MKGGEAVVKQSLTAGLAEIVMRSAGLHHVDDTYVADIRAQKSPHGAGCGERAKQKPQRSLARSMGLRGIQMMPTCYFGP